MLPLNVLLPTFLSTKSILYLPTLEVFLENPSAIKCAKGMELSITKYV